MSVAFWEKIHIIEYIKHCGEKGTAHPADASDRSGIRRVTAVRFPGGNGTLQGAVAVYIEEACAAGFVRPEDRTGK